MDIMLSIVLGLLILSVVVFWIIMLIEIFEDHRIRKHDLEEIEAAKDDDFFRKLKGFHDDFE